MFRCFAIGLQETCIRKSLVERVGREFLGLQWTCRHFGSLPVLSRLFISAVVVAVTGTA